MQKPSLLHRLLHAFDAPEPPPLPAPDEKLALGALMVRVAMSDHSYKFAEVHRIDLLLRRLFGLGPIEAAKMRATSERLEREAPDTEEFGDILRKTVSFAARVDALEALWEVTLADGRRSIELVTAIYASIREGGVKKLPLARGAAFYGGWMPDQP